MNFNFFIISILIISGLAGSAFAQPIVQSTQQEFTQEEIDEMKNKGVLIQTNIGSFTIEFFPEDAPNHVHNFLKLVESGYYDGMVFHRIIPGFMIQVGDPNTKNPEIDRLLWGSGGPGYAIENEFNTIKHNRGIVSMARSAHPDSAGSQFFIVHRDSPMLDGKYTAFGRLVPGLPNALNDMADLRTDMHDMPLDTFSATIVEAKVLEPFAFAGFAPPQKNQSIVRETQPGTGGNVFVYQNELHKINFNLPYRWNITSESSGGDLAMVIEPNLALEHNAKTIVEQSGFIPQLLVNTKPKSPTLAENLNFFSIRGGDQPEVSHNYIFENEEGKRAHLMVSTQNLETETETIQFKIIQLRFSNSNTDYSIVYLNINEWFRYEVNAFFETVRTFEIMIDGEMQPIDFTESPVLRQVISEVREKPEPAPAPPARIGGCLIATASYGSELSPQVQLLREIRDNTVLQTQSGTSFMGGFNQFYYSFSPTIADYERENPVFKEAVKLTLTPLLTSLTLLQYTDIDSEHEMLGYGIGLILLNIGMYFVAPAILITKIRSFYKLQ